MSELPPATSLNDLLSHLMTISEQSLDDLTQQRLKFFRCKLFIERRAFLF